MNRLHSIRMSIVLPPIRRWLGLWTPPTPAGVTDISRWSSAATPPGRGRPEQPILEGWQRTPDAHRSGNPTESHTSGIPPGCVSGRGLCSGGVAALNHRLRAGIPAGMRGNSQVSFFSCVAPHVLQSVAYHSVKGRSFAERKTTLGEALNPPRRGATLVEVLMALLIMAVGVTSVFTLFPISIIKAIKANQLTNAKLYEGAIQDTLLTHPQLWTGAPEWRENTFYAHTVNTAQVQDLWVSPKPEGRMLPDTNQLFFCAANAPTGTQTGTRVPAFQIRTDWNSTISAPAVPNATLSRGGYMNRFGQAAGNGFPSTVGPSPAFLVPPASDGALAWTPYRHSPYLANTLWSSYMVDPLGWHQNNTAGGVIIPDQAQFGRITSGDISGGNPNPESTAYRDTHAYLDRIHCQFATGAANGIFRLPDSWNVVTETTPVVASVPAANRIQIGFPPTIDLTQQGQLDRIRIVLSSTLSSRVVSLPVQASSTVPLPTYPTVAGYSSIEINGAIPTGFTAATFAATFDQARIEVQAPGRYSWLMAVHSGPRGEYNAQCAIVFNRSFETVDEQGYRAEFCVTEGAGDTMWTNGRDDTNIAKVRWLYDPNTDPPKIKEGGYIFDASHGYWYKIQKIEVDQERVDGNTAGTVIDTPNSTGTYVRTIMTLSDQVQVSTGPVFNNYLIDPAHGTADCQAVLMPGVVHVFIPEPPQ